MLMLIIDSVNTAELTAVAEGLNWLHRYLQGAAQPPTVSVSTDPQIQSPHPHLHPHPVISSVVISSDSMYATEGLQGKWKIKANLPLITKVREIISTFERSVQSINQLYSNQKESPLEKVSIQEDVLSQLSPPFISAPVAPTFLSVIFRNSKGEKNGPIHMQQMQGGDEDRHECSPRDAVGVSWVQSARELAQRFRVWNSRSN